MVSFEVVEIVGKRNATIETRADASVYFAMLEAIPKTQQLAQVPSIPLLLLVSTLCHCNNCTNCTN